MEQYYPRIDRLLIEHPETTKGVLFVTRRSCAPVHEIYGVTAPKCRGLVENALSLAKDPDVDTVVIAAAWNRNEVFESQEREVAFQDLSATINSFRKIGRHVYLILPIPKGEPFDPAHLVTRTILDFGFVLREQVDREEVNHTVKPIAIRLIEVARSAGAAAIDPVDYLCGE